MAGTLAKPNYPTVSDGLCHLETYCGPHPYGDEPAVLAALDIGADALASGPARCASIARACASWFDPPAMAWQSPDRGEEIAAFLAAWTLALLRKGGGFLHEARAFRLDGRLHVCLGYHDEKLTLAALHLATDLFARVDTADPAAIESNLEQFWRLARSVHPDFQVRFLMKAARAADIPCLPFFSGHRLWQFGWGRNGNLFFESEPKGDSAIGWKIARDKAATKAVFASLGIRMAAHRLALSEAELPGIEQAIGWPCVVKPTTGGRAAGVTTDVDGSDRLRDAFRHAQAQGKGPVMIERQVEGEVYRINVNRGSSATILRRAAVAVTGDGRHSVAELIEQSNRTAAEPDGDEPRPGRIAIDDKLTAQLARQGLGLDAVPAAGREVLLSRTALLGGGASYHDVTAQAHPDIGAMAGLLAKSLGLEYCGIDFVSRDITRSCAEEGAVLEINTTPGLRAAESAGMTPEAIGREVLGDGLGRIPVTLVVADAADTVRIGDGLRFGEDQGWVVGERCGLGSLVLGGFPGPADGSPPPLADLVTRLLRNPLAASLTIVCTPERLAEAGLPIDRYECVIACPSGLGPAWREVLERRAGRWIDVPGAGEAVARIGDAS